MNCYFSWRVCCCGCEHLDVFLAVSEIHVVTKHCSRDACTLPQYISNSGTFVVNDPSWFVHQFRTLWDTCIYPEIAHWDVTPACVLAVGDAPPVEPRVFFFLLFPATRPIDSTSGRVPTYSTLRCFWRKKNLKMTSLACRPSELLAPKGHRYVVNADL